LARSSGKAILLGEHAVVYGVPAIAVGIERGATAEAELGSPARVTLGDRSAIARDGSELGRAYAAVLDTLGMPECSVTVTLDVPAGVGLGASAAIGVSIARAVLALGGSSMPELGRVVDAAMAWERVFHGNPSGVDAWASAHGGCVSFTRGAAIKPLPVKRELILAIAVAGPPASTKSMVEGVAKLRDKKPEMVKKSFDGIESLVKNAALCVEAGDLPGLGKLLDLNQMLLAGLMLSTEEIERACGAARQAGALGAKLTGSGGGGCVIALADQDPEPILSAWRRDGLTCFSSVVKANTGVAP
jgi:mevalonate kinase